MNQVCLFVLAVLGISVATSVAEFDISKLPAASARKDVTYDKDIKSIFEASCFRCHGDKQKKGGIRLDSLEAVLKGGKEGTIVEVGNSVKSTLLISVSQLDPETAMPPKSKARKSPGGPSASGEKKPEVGGHAANQAPAKPLTSEQVGLVRAWIDQGAK